MWSLSKQVDDIVNDYGITNNPIKRLTEKQINLPDSKYNIMKILNFLKINFNKNVNEALRLAYKCGNVVTFLDKFDTDVVSIFSFKK